MKDRRIAAIVVAILCVSAPAFSQQTGKEEQSRRQIEKDKILRKRIEQPIKAPEIKEGALPVAAGAQGEARVQITSIHVIGATLVPESEIRSIVAPFENKDLTLRDMRQAADRITDAYRKHGFVTSRAVLGQQRIENGVLEIQVIEGVTGTVEFKGNKFFSSGLLEKKLHLPPGQPFNFDTLRQGLSRINAVPDRSAKALLVPGKEPGATDVVIQVQDRLPIHAGFDWDDFGSRYIGRDRYRTTLSHNNLTGHDDVLSAQFQLSEADYYRYYALRYLYPLGYATKLGVYAARSNIRLGKEWVDLDARGKSRVYSLFASQTLLDDGITTLTWNSGFDYKDVFNFQSGTETSRDRLRVVKTSLDLDAAQWNGRTIISDELSYGIPDFMAGLKDKDARASRAGAGGEFTKDNFNFLRLQEGLPWDTSVLLKSDAQYTNNILPAAEQYQIGGIANVRGYPSAEVVGDSGLSATVEGNIPAYFIPRESRVPWSKAYLYDAFRFVVFYDWAAARLERPLSGEEKGRTLRGAGWGMRLNLPENFSARLEFAWPLDNTPSDGEHLHTWASVSKTF